MKRCRYPSIDIFSSSGHNNMTMRISKEALISSKYKDLALKAAQKFVPEDDEILVALKGGFKEYLICTDKQLYIIKEGYMTGHTFGQGIFKLPYRNITSVSVDWHLISGYFEVSSGGIQHTKKSYWATRNNPQQPRESPNAISLTTPVKDDFAKATDIINGIIERVHRDTVSPTSTSQQSDDFNDQVEQLRSLKKLLDEELITKEEFDLKKKTILGI